MIRQPHDQYEYGSFTKLASALSQLVTPVHFLRIKHETLTIHQLYIPLFFAVMLGTPLGIYFDVKQLLGGDTSLINGVSELLQFLVGFFVTALAVIATYSRKGLDEPMKGTPAKLSNRILNTRQFLTYLYGYLALSSFLLYMLNLCLVMAAPFFFENSNLITPPLSHTAIRCVATIIYTFILAHVFTVFLLGLHFLTDLRANRSDPDGATSA